MKNLSDVDVPLMTHLGDNMRGAPLLEEDWPRVNDSPLCRGTESQLTHQPQSQDLTSLLTFPVKWLFMSARTALIVLMV